MNGDSKDRKTSMPVYGWVALIAAVAGVWYVKEPLVPSGPHREFTAPFEPERGKVPARLWQDPLKVVRDAQKGGRIEEDVALPLLEKGDIVLPVAVPEGDHVELHEDRLKIRYAVLTALGIAGYVPLETENLLYFSADGQQSLIPYEWLEADRLRGSAATRVLVLWLESEKLTKDLACQISHLLEPLNWKLAKPKIRLVGPAWSDDLKNILESGNLEHELKAIFGNDDDGFPVVQVLSPRATADMGILYRLCRNCDFDALSSSWDEKKPIVRTISSDRKLAGALVGELISRGIITEERGENQIGEIAILAEWDTSYGRGFPLMFALCYEQALDKLHKGQRERLSKCDAVLRDPARFQWPYQVRQVIYMRGLEGNLPGNDGGSTVASTRKSEKNDGEKGSGEESKLDWAEGTRRFDYIERLVNTLERKSKNVKAIGVVGSDVHDKLLLLQALRPRFPGAVFFTTDLDARLLHRSTNEWTRNLIVASSFGLVVGMEEPARVARDAAKKEKLARELGKVAKKEKLTKEAARQKKVADELEQLIRRRHAWPPFRDSYQTAVFLSTLLALDKISIDAVKWAAKPKLYEVGRRYPPIRLWEQIKIPGEWTSKEGTKRLRFIANEVRLGLPEARWLIGLLVLTAVLLLVLLRTLRSPAFWEEDEWRRCARCYFVFSAVVFMGIAVVIIAVFSDEHPEPFAWLEGVSVWPTELIRLLAAVLAFHFLVKANSRIHRSNEQLPKRFDLPAVQPDEPGLLSRKCWHEIRRYLKSDWTEQKDVPSLWKEYQKWGRPKRRWARVIPVSVIYVGAAFCLFGIYGFSGVPYRGSSSWLADRLALIISVSLQVALIFYVIDAILLCRRFVEKLSRPEVGWAEEGTQLDPDYYEIELKFDLIARRTEAVGSLIYYPFVVLPLMIFSRLSYFDRWDWPFSLVVVLGANAVLAIVAALLLRRSAEDAREDILSTLRLKRIELRKQDAKENMHRLEQIEKILDDGSEREPWCVRAFDAEPRSGGFAAAFRNSGLSLRPRVPTLARS